MATAFHPAISRRTLIASSVAAAAIRASGAPVHPRRNDPMKLSPYILFDGSCADAMTFYHSVFGGDLHIGKVKDTPAKDHMPAFQHDKVLNARLESGGVAISASDWLMPGAAPVRGNTVCLFLMGRDAAEQKRVFDKLAEGGEVTNPLQQQFFGLYGALNDRFGVRWMFLTNA